MKRKSLFFAILAASSAALSGCNGGSDGAGPLSSSKSGPVSGPAPAPLIDLPSADPVNPSVPLARAELLQIGRSGIVGAKQVVAMDFQSMDLHIVIDNAAGTSRGEAEIAFESHGDGYPYFLLDGTVLGASLNGAPVTLSKTMDPGGLNEVQLVGAAVTAGATQVLRVSYELPSDAVGYRAGGVGFVTAMADIDSGNFFEAYGPANYEDDQFRLTLRVDLANVSNAHRVFTNGRLTELGPFSWRVDFPEYFNSSGIYFHVTDLDLAVRTTTVQGLEQSIPVTVYAADSASADSAIAAVPGLFGELEGAYGPYLHESFTAYISGAGGMEHSGATITSLSALGHELTHSWFGRGVLPGGGAAGWLDEAIASWRDYDYPRASSPTTALRTPTNMASLSRYDRFTPYNSYADGRTLMSEFDRELADRGGLQPLLKRFFSERKGQVIATADFEDFFLRESGLRLDWMFERYVFGSATQAGTLPSPQPSTTPTGTLHPRPLTKEDIKRLR